MMGADMGIGEGAQLGGDIMAQIGAAQGARAMAEAKKAQLAEQQAFQRQANQRLGLVVANNSPWSTQSQYDIQSAQPGQAYIEALGHAAPLGLSTGPAGAPAAKAFQERSGDNMGQLQAAGARLRQLQGIDRSSEKLQQAEAEGQSDIAGIRKKAGQAAGLYALDDQVAAGHGMALRMGGQLLSSLGGGVAGGGFSGPSGLFGGGSGGSIPSNAGQSPRGGWATRRVYTNPDGSQSAFT